MNAWELIIQQPLINCLIVIASVFGGNFGVSIIVLTIVINLAMLPLTLSQIRSSKKMMDLQPKLAELQKMIIKCLNQLIQQMCGKVHIDANHIYEMCVVGNTAMNHIFLKLAIRQLGQAPYKAHSLEAHDIPAAKLG